MGVVYAAKDENLDRKVAIKFLPSELIDNEEARARFFREARSASSLDHSNIATIYELDEGEGKPFIVMEYVEGRTLRHIVAEEGILSLDQALDFAIQIGQGLAEAHRQGIVHRDIKGQNILITSRGQVKITDFGLAKIVGGATLTVAGTTMGSAGYIAPEQARGEEVDHRADIFSFGVVIYEMLTGRVPFRGENLVAVIHSVLNKDPKSVSALRPDVPPPLDTVIEQTLKKEKSERYQNVDDLLQDLRAVHEEIKIGEPTTTRVARPPLRVWSIRSIAIASIALLIGVIAILTTRWTGPPQIAPPPAVEKPSLAVFPFAMEADDPSLAWIGRGLSHMLTTNLSHHEALHVVSTQRLYDILEKQGKADETLFDLGSAREAGQTAEVDTIVLGRVVTDNQHIQVELEVQQTEDAELLTTFSLEHASLLELFPLVDDLTVKLLGALHLGEEIGEPTPDLASATTSSLEAYRFFFAGEEELNRMSIERAIEAYQQALVIDPNFALAAYRLAYIYTWPHQYQEARQYIDRAKKAIEKMPPKEQRLTRALGAVIDGDVEAALTMYRGVLKEHPYNTEALFQIGEIHYHARQVDKAAPYFEQVVSEDPQFERAVQHLAWAYQFLGNVDHLVEVAERYAELAPENPEAHSTLGVALALGEDFSKAVREGEKALQIDPAHYLGFYWLGQIFFLAGELDPARERYRVLTQENLHPFWHGYGYFGLAEVAAFTGQIERAIHYLERRIQIFEENQQMDQMASDYYRIAIMSCWKADYVKAHSAVEAGLKLEISDKPRFLLNWTKAWIDLQKGVAEEVRVQLDDLRMAALKEDLEHFVDMLRGELARYDGKMEEAVRYYREAIRKSGGKLYGNWYRYYLTLCYLELEDWDSAIEIAEQMQHEQTVPSFRYFAFPRSWYILGRAYEGTGEVKKATSSYRTLLDLWSGADEDIPERKDSRQRLAALTPS